MLGWTPVKESHYFPFSGSNLSDMPAMKMNGSNDDESEDEANH
jgi:hypothetical protein